MLGFQAAAARIEIAHSACVVARVWSFEGREGERLWPCTEILRVLEFYLLEAWRVEILGLVVRDFLIFNSQKMFVVIHGVWKWSLRVSYRLVRNWERFLAGKGNLVFGQRT